MDKIIEQVKKELEQVETQVLEKGFTKEKLEVADKLIGLLKDSYETQKLEKHLQGSGDDMNYGRYDDYRDRYDDRRGGGDYEPRGNYRDYGDEYGHRMMRDDRRIHNKMREYLDRMCEGMRMYEYGKERYQHGDTEGRMVDGLERLMYGVCMMVEGVLDFAETPAEKEVIRQHLRKMKEM